VLGAAVIATIQNGLYIFGQRVIYITTGSIIILRRHARHDRASPPGEDRALSRGLHAGHVPYIDEPGSPLFGEPGSRVSALGQQGRNS